MSHSVRQPSLRQSTILMATLERGEQDGRISRPGSPLVSNAHSTSIQSTPDQNVGDSRSRQRRGTEDDQQLGGTPDNQRQRMISISSTIGRSPASSVASLAINAASFGVASALRGQAMACFGDARVTLADAETAAGISEHHVASPFAIENAPERRTALPATQGGPSTRNQDLEPREIPHRGTNYSAGLAPMPARHTPEGENGGNVQGNVPLPAEPDAASISQADQTWQNYVDFLANQIKILNIVSALLIPSVLSLFQVDSANRDIVTFTLGLLALVCSFMSLCYGAIFNVVSVKARKISKAKPWIAALRPKKQTLQGQVYWIMASQPIIWTAWSLICFIASILSFAWRGGLTVGQPQPATHVCPQEELVARGLVTAVFCFGVLIMIGIICAMVIHASQKSINGGNATAQPGHTTSDPAVGVNQAQQQSN